jgi:transcriptional regulator with XRE-family HTH domain
MKHKEVLQRLRENPEYVAAEKELEPVLDIAADVVRLRTERGWSQKELARRVGTRQANISRLENGLTNPTLKFLTKVAQALDTDLSIHMGPDEAPVPTFARVIVQQEVKTVRPEKLWGSRQARRSSPMQWSCSGPSTRDAKPEDRYQAA